MAVILLIHVPPPATTGRNRFMDSETVRLAADRGLFLWLRLLRLLYMERWCDLCFSPCEGSGAEGLRLFPGFPELRQRRRLEDRGSRGHPRSEERRVGKEGRSR